MTLSHDLYHIAEHLADDQPNLPEGAKNTLLMAAKRLEAAGRMAEAAKLTIKRCDEGYSPKLDWYDVTVFALTAYTQTPLTAEGQDDE